MSDIKEIKGVLLFNKPNKHTVSSPYSKYHSLTYLIYVDAHTRGISPEEDYLVGTRCGTELYNSTRVNEYTRYRISLTKDLTEIIREKYKCLVNLQSDLTTFTNMLYRDWFGDELRDIF